jgi:uncharacterized protein (DUF39 family)
MNRTFDKTGNCRTIPEIQAKIDAGDAVVLTAAEISERVRTGKDLRLEL